jgi:asparagine synthase (glutamine-hydrolysing)
MCGIAGHISFKKLSYKKRNNTLQALKHRGPDNSDYISAKFGDKYLTLLHTRLAILDLSSRSNQPFKYKNIILVFNGEIYNFIEIRNNLRKKGITFQTSSDTEVIAAAYIYYGKKCVEIFEGMWAFSIYDENTGEIFISRDPFGEKPLFYYHDGHSFAFASETKALFTMLEINPEVNKKYINNFLGNGFRWLFKNNELQFQSIKKVSAGENLTLNTRLNIDIKKYWLPRISNQKMSKNDAIEGVKYYLNKSLKIRLRSDVPLAFCLSGGVDSGSLVSLAKNNMMHELDTFSVIDKDQRYNEENEINFLCKSLNIRNTKIHVSTNSFIEKLNQIIKHHNSPIPTVSYFLHACLLEEVANKGYKVIISGTGADEIFAGYYDHSLYWLSDTYSNSTIEKNINIWKNNFGKYIQNPELQDPLKFIKNKKSRNYLFDSNQFINAMLINQNIEEFSEVNYSANLLKNRMCNELYHEIVPVILDQDDKNSMMHSIENRSPFLDKELVNFGYSIPNNLFFDRGYSKSVLRSAVKDILPNRIRLKKEKIGFNASIQSLLSLDNNETKNILLKDSPIFDYIDRNKFKKYLDLDHSNAVFSKFLFRFLSSKLFLESVQ